MPVGKRKRFYRKKGRKKAKWRQQKLAVGTVQKIARAVAKQEDNKRIHWIVHRNLQSDPGWDSSQTAAPREEHKVVLQPNTYNAFILSDIGNLTENQLDYQPQGSMVGERTNFYFVKSLQSFLAFENNTQYPVRIRAELCFVPNLSSRTDDTDDNLQSSINTFHNGVNLQFSGMFSKFMRTEGTASAKSPIYQLLAAKEIVLPAAVQYSTPAPPASGVGQAGFSNTRRKYMTLSKHYKRPKKLIWKSYVQQQEITGAQMCDNGNFVVQIITDTTTLVSSGELNRPIGVKYWGCSGCKYYIKAARLDNEPVFA